MIFKHLNGLKGELVAKTELSLIVRTKSGMMFEDAQHKFTLIDGSDYIPFVKDTQEPCKCPHCTWERGRVQEMVS